MKNKTNISVVSNTGIRRKSEIIIGDSGPYTSGDILDANAVEQLVNSKSGGSDMPIVYVEGDVEETYNLEVGNLYSFMRTIKDVVFTLPEPPSYDFVKHIKITCYLRNGWNDIHFSNKEPGVTKQSLESIYRGEYGGVYSIDCMFEGNTWLVTAVNVQPAIL